MIAWCAICKGLHSLPVNHLSCIREYPDFSRASGSVICETCNKEYRKHPDAEEYLDFQGYHFLKRLCSGELVKL